MAYQPKYASGPRNQPEPSQPPRREDRRPESKAGKILSILLGIVLIPLSLAATVWLLGLLYNHYGSGKPPAVPTEDYTIAQALWADVHARQEALETVPADMPQQTEPPETTVPPVTHPHYSIAQDAAVAPRPNPRGFGSSTDLAVIQSVLEEGQWLLDGQALYFDPAGQRYEAEDTVRWYLDESMLVLTWKEVHDGSVYTFSEVKIQDPSQFRRHLAGGEYGSQLQFLTTEMAESVNAVVASAGDFYRFRDFGAVVYEGVARRVEGTYAETCYIDRNGDMHFTYGGDVLTVQAVQDFVDQHDITFSLAFGPVLVADGQTVEHTWYGVGEINEGYARAALCQMDTLHYLLVTANTQGVYQEIPTVAAFQSVIAATGCVNAYCLDGGQTASIVMNNQLINRPVYGQQRKISDIIYFATAVPEEG